MNKQMFDTVRKIRLSQSDLNNVVKSDRKDFEDYPWEDCISDQEERYGDPEIAKRICGWIKANYKNNFQEGDDLEGSCWPGYTAIGLKPSEDGSRMVPNCVPEKEGMSKVKSGYTVPSSKTTGSSYNKDLVKEGFPIPSPNAEESESDYVSRCIKEIYDEYGQEQSAAICYAKYQEK